MARVYVASSWRNEHYKEVIASLEASGHQVWDWRNPPTGGSGFKWQDAGHPEYKHGDKFTPETIRQTLSHPVAVAAFASDLCGMHWADVGVLLFPSGKSAHMEAAYMAGRGKLVHMLVPEPVEPDLMVMLLSGQMCASIDSLLWRLR